MHYLIDYINKKQQEHNDYNSNDAETIIQEESFDEKIILYSFIENLFNVLKTLQDKVDDQSEIITNMTEENTDLNYVLYLESFPYQPTQK